MSDPAPLDVHPDVELIYPDDDAPVYEGYKVRLASGGVRPYAFFPDTTYGSSEGALRAADAWARRAPVDTADTRNIVRIEIAEKVERKPKRRGTVREVKTRRSTQGWQVRMTRQGVAHSHFFSDGHFGGREGALAAAQHWRNTRDAVLTRVDPDVARDRSRSTRSQFGVPGLRLLLIDVGNGRQVPYLQASWPAGDDGRRVRRGLSLEKHDPQDATARLCQLLVEKRGRAALPAEGSPAPAHIPVPDAPGLAAGVADADEREALLGTFAEAYRRAWPSVREGLEAYRHAAPDDEAPPRSTS